MPQRLERRKCSSVLSTRKKKSTSVTKVIEKPSRISLDPSQWLLPETEEYLRMNDKQQDYTRIIEREQRYEEVSADSTKETPTPYDEVRSYLKKNGLVVKGLTIFDVLHPTTVTVRNPSYIQVIDRHVMAKVWDDILPLAYGSYVGKLRLVNHYAVNLEKYESDLKGLIEDYYKFTSKFIWEHLSDDDKKKVGPNMYWISLPTEDQDRLAKEITEDEHVNQTALELFAWRKLSEDEQKRLLQRPPIYHEKTHVMLQNTLQGAGNESALQGISRMDAEIKRGIKFLQIATDLRQYQKRAETQSKPEGEQTLDVKTRAPVIRHNGRRVLCRYDPDGYFYAGTLHRHPDGHLMIMFDMDVEQEAVGHILLPTSNSVNQSSLFLNDCVLVRQMRNNEEYWAPGLVMGLPGAFTLPPNVYMIQVRDPTLRDIYAHRKDLVRITVAFFQRSVLYLQHLYRSSRLGDRPIRPYMPGSPKRPGTPVDFDKMFRELLNQLSEKVERMNESHRNRYQELQITLKDHKGAIRILQEPRAKPPTQDDGTQTGRSERLLRGMSPEPPPTISPPKISPPHSPVRHRFTVGDRVYAVWAADDGLVYESTVLKRDGPSSYCVERCDLRGIVSDVSDCDLFATTDVIRLKKVHERTCAFVEYPGDPQNCHCPADSRCCLCLPDSRHCLFPAVILGQNDTTTRVRFYDCLEKDLDNNQHVLPIDQRQFQRYVQARIDKELSLQNQVAVGLNNATKTFMLGTIKKRFGNGHQYEVEWHDGTKGEQNDENLFTAIFTRPDRHVERNYVLALDDKDGTYKPASVVSVSPDRKTLTVEFTPSRRTTDHPTPKTAQVPTTTTFVINEEYHYRISQR